MPWKDLELDIAEEMGLSAMEIGPIGSGVHITTPSMPGRKNDKLQGARFRHHHREERRKDQLEFYHRVSKYRRRLKGLVAAAERLLVGKKTAGNVRK